MRQAHLRDAVAMVKFFTWLENELKSGKKHDEVSIADRLEEFRSQQKEYVSLSFDTIAGSGGNGAIIHYHAHKETAAAVTTDKLLLLDSGAQYKYVKKTLSPFDCQTFLTRVNDAETAQQT